LSLSHGRYTGPIEFDAEGERLLPVAFLNVESNAIVKVGTWQPDLFVSPEYSRGDLERTKTDALCGLRRTDFRFGTLGFTQPIMWADGTQNRPTGASTFVDIALLSPSTSMLASGGVAGSSYFNSWRAAIEDAIGEINASPALLTNTQLRLATITYDDYAQLLPAAGEAVSNPLVTHA
jgi:hypothetical protein